MHLGSYTSSSSTPRDEYRPHDTRRGVSRYSAAEGWAEADRLLDHAERELALDAIRARENRAGRAARNLPTSHQTTAMLADVLGLLLPRMADDATRAFVLATMRRVLRHRGFDASDPEVIRCLDIRLRPHRRIEEAEAQERIAARVAADLRARRQRQDRDALATMFAADDAEAVGA